MFDENDDRWADVRQKLRDLLGGDGEAWDAAKRSTLNAHYTAPDVVVAMWGAVRDLGFDRGRVLEPGCGSGNFIAYAPEGAAMVGVERDATTAAVARVLYPDAEIHHSRFERFDVRTPFDAAIGNVPFGDIVPTDPRYNRGRLTLHNYFLGKSLQLVRPGGIVVGLTSRWTLDARNPAARRELAQHGDLLGALRLPSGAMQKTAGTEAILDLLVLRRRAPGAEPAGVLGWDRSVETGLVHETTGTVERTWMNRYLVDHPNHVLGEPVLGRGMHHDHDLMVRGDLTGMGSQVAERLASIIAASDLRYEPAATPSRTASGRPRRPQRIGDVEVRGDRRVPLRQGSFVVARTGVIYQHDRGELISAGLGKGTSDEVRALVELRDSTVNLLRLEADDAPDSDIEATRRQLAEGYRRYHRRWGPLNRVSWHGTGRVDPSTGEERRRRVAARLGGFRHDPEWPTLAAIEVYDEETGVASPAPIQHQRTIHPPAPKLGADTAEEALAISLDEHGRVDLDRIAELLGVDQDAAETEIAALVYTDPVTHDLVPAEDYLSGDIRRKLDTARHAAQSDVRFERNIEGLTRVQPPQIAAGDIVVRPGVPWVEPSDVTAFAREVLDIAGAKVTYTSGFGTWDVDGHGPIEGGEFSTLRVPVHRLLEATLNQRMVRVYDLTDDDKRVLNVAETTAAREKQEVLAERFSRWVWEDPERATRLADRYNAVFNSYVPPNYTGEHLTLPGLTTTFVPHGHQRAAVARILREGRALLGHAVGAGKTATMVMAGMELRRLGLANRPAYVVPNHMLEQFSREYLQLYPQARLLVATRNLTGTTGRKEFIARAATSDWDAVIVTHSAFERLPLRESTLEAYIKHQTAEMQAQLAAAQTNIAMSLDPTEKTRRERTVKKMETMLARHEARLERLVDMASKDDGVCFEETGIDYLFVDELHLFKNLTIVTSVEGVGREGSKRASDLDAKLWYLHETNGGRSLVGATATPIANSISEAWVMQRYLQPDVLTDADLDKFDAWAATFAQQVNAVELAPDGGSYRVATRLARYQNVPELISQFRRTADVRVRDDLDLKLPTIKDETPQVVVVPASDALETYVESLVKRAEAVRNRTVEPEDDNMLKITSDGRHAALDLRLVGHEPDPAGGKLEAAAQRIAAIYRDTRQFTYLDTHGQPSPRTGGFQFVFCDLSTPKYDGTWNAYSDLKQRLITHGVPADEIAFIHDAGTNDEARARLFAKCRDGHIAVLLGSTEKMGVGTNIHTRAVALHHIDCPWRPADIEQREGRIVRQGNQNDEIQILRYATEGSFDVYMWQTVERKGTFISQLMRGDNIGRDIDDVGDAVLSYSEVKALASGNPLIIEHAGVQADLSKYERLEHAHREEQRQLKMRARRHRAAARKAQERTGDLQAAIEQRMDTSGDRFAIEIDGKTYTKRPDAAARLTHELRATINDLRSNSDNSQASAEPRPLAKLAGFDITLKGFRFKNYTELVLRTEMGEHLHSDLHITAENVDSDSFNVLTRLENPIRRLDDELAKLHNEINELDDEATTLESRQGHPFPHQDRLAQLRSRNQQILDQLNTAAEEAAAAAEQIRRASPPSPDPTAKLDEMKARPDDPPSPDGPGLSGSLCNRA